MYEQTDIIIIIIIDHFYTELFSSLEQMHCMFFCVTPQSLWVSVISVFLVHPGLF